MIGDIGFDKDGMTYGLLYADAWRDLETSGVKVEWYMKFYSSSVSRKRSLNKYLQPGKPIFLFELSIKQVADLGVPLPYVPDEKRRKYSAPDAFYDRVLFKK